MSEEKKPLEPLVLPATKEPRRITETLLCRKCIKDFGPIVENVIQRQHFEAGFIGNREGIQIWCLRHQEAVAAVEVESGPPPRVCSPPMA